MMYKGLFKSRYPSLRGRDWINSVSTEDRKAFAMLGLQASDYGRMGGRKMDDVSMGDFDWTGDEQSSPRK